MIEMQGDMTNVGLISESAKEFAVFMIDSKGYIANWNGSILRLLKYDEGEFVGHAVTEFFPDEATKKTLSSLLLSSGGDGMTEFEGVCLRKGNARFRAAINLWKLTDESGAERGIFVVLHDLSGPQMIEQQMKDSERQLRSLASRLQEVREEERTKIARELHDEFGQMLTALHMDLSLLQRMVSKIVTDPVGRVSVFGKINSISELVEKTIRSARRIITELRPAVLDELGLLTAIQWQALEFENRTGIRCRITRLQHDVELKQSASTAVFRILQEALTNVAKHSEATSVTISLQVVDGNMVVEIADDGKGMAEDKKKDPTSTGILGIRERVIALNGEFKIKSVGGKGTTLTISIPYPDQGGEHRPV